MSRNDGRAIELRFPFEEDTRFRCGQFHGPRRRYTFIGKRPQWESPQAIKPHAASPTPSIEASTPQKPDTAEGAFNDHDFDHPVPRPGEHLGDPKPDESPTSLTRIDRPKKPGSASRNLSGD